MIILIISFYHIVLFVRIHVPTSNYTMLPFTLVSLLIFYLTVLQDKSRKATGMQIDALEDGYVDHELFSLSSIKVRFFITKTSNRITLMFCNY